MWFEAETTLGTLVKQRRRWMNGGMAAAIWALRNVARCVTRTHRGSSSAQYHAWHKTQPGLCQMLHSRHPGMQLSHDAARNVAQGLFDPHQPDTGVFGEYGSPVASSLLPPNVPPAPNNRFCRLRGSRWPRLSTP
jgi:hypothetical protein